LILLRNRLRYAFTRSEVVAILQQRLISVDNKVRTDVNFPAGFMDVISIPKTNEFFRLLYDVKGKFAVHRITKEEAAYKLCRVQNVSVGEKGVPFLGTHDGRTVRYPDPDVKKHDSVRISMDGKILDFIRFEVGNLVMITGGRNLGRVGVIEKREKHIGGFDIVHVKDSNGRSFATRVGNVFVIGKGSESYVSLPARKGVKMTLIEETEYRRQKERELVAASKAKSKK
jgi:small subunit ribosomal protein S4e